MVRSSVSRWSAATLSRCLQDTGGPADVDDGVSWRRLIRSALSGRWSRRIPCCRRPCGVEGGRRRGSGSPRRWRSDCFVVRQGASCSQWLGDCAPPVRFHQKFDGRVQRAETAASMRPSRSKSAKTTPRCRAGRRSQVRPHRRHLRSGRCDFGRCDWAAHLVCRGRRRLRTSRASHRCRDRRGRSPSHSICGSG